MTKLEQVTLFKWMNREIHLSGPPRFLTKTHTSAEQDVFAYYDRNHMGYRLYGILPAGITLSESNPKYHFCNTALLANRDAPTRAALERMLLEAQVITSEPKSQDRRAQMGSGNVTMQATDSLTTDIPRVGMDDHARALLYRVYARGHSTLSHTVIRAVFATAAKMAVFDVQSVESPGLTDFSTHRWDIAFAQITCPPALARVRRLEVSHGDERLVFDIQHPRATRRAPCSKCLSIRHGSADCTSKHAQQSLQRHTIQVQVEAVTPLPKLTAALSPPSLKLQLRQLRQLAAPDLAARLRHEKKERKAETKKQVAQAAAQVARDAAREARLVAAARRHEEEDRARHQLRRAQKTQREVTQQLAALQRVARSNASRGQSMSSHHGSDATDHSGPDSTDSELGDSNQRGSSTAASLERPVPAPAAPDGNGDAAMLGEEESGGSSEQSEQSEPEALNHSEAECSQSAEGTKDEEDAGDSDESHGSAKPSAPSSTHASTEGNALVATSVSEGMSVPTKANESNAVGETTASDALASSEASDGARQVVPTPLVFDAVPLVTGKRAAPPSPSSSDDESRQQAKWAQGPLPAPFSADVSPIVGAEDVSITLVRAESRPVTTRSGRRQLPPLPSDDGEPAVPADQRTKRRQQALSEFYAPESLAEAQARMESEIAARQSRAPAQLAEQFPSPALDAKLIIVCSPSMIAAWKKAFGAKVIQVPGNGGCLYYALYCCRTGWKLLGTAITVKSTHSVEANHYKAGVCKEYQAYLDQMLSDGTITIAELTQRYFNARRDDFDKKVRRKTMETIRRFIDGIAGANLGGKGLERSQWAGDAELYSTV